MATPFFSILIPVYNVEKYLPACLESVLRQSFMDYEIILVDDGSKDTSGQICDKYAAMYSEIIHVQHKPNQGLISARRAGLKLANGQYICFLDSDDCWLDNTLSRLHEVIRSTGSDVILYRWCRIDEHGNTLQDTDPAVFSKSGPIDKRIVFERMLSTSGLNSFCTKCCKRELFDLDADYSRYYTIQNGEDLIQSLPVLYQAKTFYYLAEELYQYRVNTGSITHTYQKCQYKTLEVLRPLLFTYLQKMSMDTEDNINIFFDMYIKILWDNLEALFRGVHDTAQRHLILNEIKGYSFVQKARKYLSNSSLNVMKRMGLMMFYSCNNAELEWYMKFYLSCVGILRKIR